MMDPDIDIDFIEESQENIDDELLISIVRENPVLYEKTSKDYKNKELKFDIWESIGETFGCTGEQAEGRWNTLRNKFTKKLREMKAGQPSGSGWKKAKIWVYFKQMSFLTPHIAHRISRSSIVHSKQDKSNISQSIMRSPLFNKDSTVKISSLPSNDILSNINAMPCSDDSISSDSCNESLSANIAISDQSPSSEQSFVTLTDRKNNVSQHMSNRVQKKTAADIITETKDNLMQTKTVVPAPDQFAAKKQKKIETVENVLSQSSHAFNVMATAFLHRVTTQQEQQQHPYITAIAEAMKKVPDEQQLICFMSVMQIISTYSHDT